MNNIGPYSHFRVGCALLAVSPSFPSILESSDAADYDEEDKNENIIIITGANVENASYPVGTCAERCAVAKGVVSLLFSLVSFLCFEVLFIIWSPLSLLVWGQVRYQAGERDHGPIAVMAMRS